MSAVGGAVADVATMGELDVAPLHQTVVRRVVGMPALAVVHLHPGVRLPFAFDQSVHVACPQADASAGGYHQVGKVLAYTLSRLEYLKGRGGVVGGVALVGEE